MPSDANENDLEKVFKKLADSNQPEFLDAWGTKLKVERAPWDQGKTLYVIHGAGIDKAFGTDDDQSAYLYFRRSKVVTTAAPGDTRLHVEIEHNRGANHDRAEISGIAIDPSGAVIPDAVIAITNMTIGNSKIIRTNQQGEFHATALYPAIYQVTVSSPGFRQAEDSFQLEARDRAEITARLQLGFATQSVEVSASSVVVLSAESTFMNRVAGVPGGVAGGVMGGVVGGIAAEKMAWAPAPSANTRSLLVAQVPTHQRSRVHASGKVGCRSDRGPGCSRALLFSGDVVHKPRNHHRSKREC